MGLSVRNRKRILIFSLIPVLIAILFLAEDLVLKIISAAVLVLYVGFIIFLRDSVREESFDTKFDEVPSEPDQQIDSEPKNKNYEFDDGEDFKILSPSKIEVITSENYTPSYHDNKSRDFFKPSDLKQNFAQIATEELPENVSHDEQFAFVLEKILNVVKEAYMAHTSIFFWYNKSKERLTLEKFVSSSAEFITEQKFEIEDDILSKIVKKEEPELLTDITPNAERDVIRYYNSKQGIKSFVGVPLFYGKSLAGVLALDSKVHDAFGIETIYSLGRFVRVLSIIISLFEDKFAESQAEQRLKSLLSVLNIEKKFANEKELFALMETSVKDLLQWNSFVFVYFDPTDQKFRTSKIVNKTTLKYIGENFEVELGGTLVGKAILSGMPIKIDDTSTGEYFRFSKNEDISFDGSFLAIPLIYDDQNYGVLCFESLKKNLYTTEDVHFMKQATKIFSFMVHSFSAQKVLKGLLSVDIETKTLNQETFITQLRNDLVKANEMGAEGAIALIKIDEFIEEESLFESNPFPKVLKSIANIIKEEITPVNLLGRLDERLFGVYFFNASTKDVFLWAEKLRIKIARKPIAVVTKQTTFTVSVGVASASGKTDVKIVLENAELALNKALEKGGNTVKSIN
ncbi:MAG: GAF domain-containing protein [Melioribacteraceae bacterium]|jgi:diguanylate cyclase (GGDEF)-like protein|nr:GAF domain-containing protein [Melioribacteraceae bacterium]RJP61446.1 MAG: diguanylate cyclase [Ignavibacteriales bacterium]WKZ68493.1 MAG: GAF domain-containing protein [Melioribacteraceae bacterium]